MAEGGVAAALANVDDRDSWQVHFADTMRGGQYVNNWRMAELHAKEAPDRVRELEAWGALFDRTPDGRILQRNFGGHKYPRLAHVGDRTGLEMIRTLQDHGIHQGIDVHMECTVLRLFKDGERIAGALGYDRERGRFRLFRARRSCSRPAAIGRAYTITSNSWEYTGDGHALAYHAGAALQDMEFVQFHPTGMIWPPSVRGILVTEGVRGEGGVLRNSEGRRFMFDDIPENYRAQTADNEEEGWRYTQGDKNARRPPELLTRDHVARCIMREVREGRGSPHGGVFLDISWIKERLPNAREHIKRKLPSMYHQFKQLADIDITTTPMEVGPTTHYVMGGIRVDGDTQMSTVPGLFAAGECAAGLHGANRLGGNSLSDLLVFGKRAGEHAAKFARERGARRDRPRPRSTTRSAHGARAVRARRRGRARGPYQVQHELQEMMQDLVGIVRTEPEMERALEGIGRLRAAGGAGRRRRATGSTIRAGTRRSTSTTCSPSPRRSPAPRSSGRRAAAATSATTIRTRIPPTRSSTSWSARAWTAEMQLAREPIPEMPEELRAGDRGAEVDARPGNGGPTSHRRDSSPNTRDTATFRVWRGDAARRAVRGLHDAGVARAWWCSTRSTRSRPSRRTTSRCAGTARPASAARARPRSTAAPSSCA